jgi:NitT/TauT family transport system ATP-binding protein
MLAFRDVSKTFGGRIQAVDRLSLEVAPGEFVAVVGPSGSGKTTIVRLGAGLLEPDSGTLTLDGRSPFEYRRSRSVGYVSQRLALLPWRTAAQNARLPAELGQGRSAAGFDDQLDRVFELLRIADYRDLYPHELSGGIAQRVAVGRALLCDSPMVFMDEPFSALDAINRERLWTDIANIFQEERATAMLVTHHITEAVAMSDRVLVITPRPARLVGEVRIPTPRPRPMEFHRSTAARDAELEVRQLLQRGEPVEAAT